MRRATAALEREPGRAPTADELAAVTRLSCAAIAELDRLARATQARSRDAANAAGESLRAVRDVDAVCPARSAESDDTRTFIRAALARLTPRHAQVLRRYCLDDATPDDIATEPGISKERVRQIRETTAQKLREDFIVLAPWQSVLTRD